MFTNCPRRAQLRLALTLPSNILVKIGEAPEGASCFLRWLLRGQFPRGLAKVASRAELLGIGLETTALVHAPTLGAFRGSSRDAQET